MLKYCIHLTICFAKLQYFSVATKFYAHCLPRVDRLSATCRPIGCHVSNGLLTFGVLPLFGLIARHSLGEADST